MKDEQLRYVYVNRTCARLGRKQPQECVGLTDRDLWPQFAEPLQANDLLVFKASQPLSSEDIVPDENGNPRHWLAYKFPFTNAAGQRLVGGMAIDITERRQAEQEARESRRRLEALSRQLISAQESERRRIARELHDEIGQTLTAIGINLQAAGLAADEPSRQRLDEASAIVDHAIEQVRHLSLDLRPSILDDLGLDAALRWYANRQIQRTGLAVRLFTQLEDERLPTEVETTCFRVTQEALTNVARHAHAQRVWIELRQLPGAVELDISDDGVGFDLEIVRRRAAAGESLGLLGMQERVELLGGSFTADSQPGQGTRIYIRLPLGGRRPRAKGKPWTG
jgi:signal transduction histidine kinase